MLIREYDDRLSMSSEPRTCGKHIRGAMFAAIAETGVLDLTVTLQIYEHGPCLFHFKQSFNYNCASIKTNAKSVLFAGVQSTRAFSVDQRMTHLPNLSKRDHKVLDPLLSYIRDNRPSTAPLTLRSSDGVLVVIVSRQSPIRKECVRATIRPNPFDNFITRGPFIYGYESSSRTTD